MRVNRRFETTLEGDAGEASEGDVLVWTHDQVLNGRMTTVDSAHCRLSPLSTQPNRLVRRAVAGVLP
jgi:hypothetical protein